MTTTMPRPGTATRTDLLGLLHDTLDLVADRDSDAFDSRTEAGQVLLALAALARKGAGTLGGTALATGRGVVVVREFAAAVRALDGASGSAKADGELGTAKGLHARLHDTVA